MWVRWSLRLSSPGLCIDPLDVLQDLVDGEWLMSLSTSLARQNLVQFVWRDILVGRRLTVVIKSARPLLRLSRLCSWVLIVEVLELIFAGRRVEESRSWVVGGSHSNREICGIVIIVVVIINIDIVVHFMAPVRCSRVLLTIVMILIRNVLFFLLLFLMLPFLRGMHSMR